MEESRRLLLRTQLRWFQLARIAEDALPAMDGHDRLLAGLSQDLQASSGDLARGSGVGTTPKTCVVDEAADSRDLPAVRALAAKGGRVVRAPEVKRALSSELKRLDESADPRTRAFAAAGEQFLGLESVWRYQRDFRAARIRTRQLWEYARRTDTEGLAENAWLSLRLAFALALHEPTYPRRALLESAAVVLDEEPHSKEWSRHQLLLDIGKGAGDTLPERMWASLRQLRQRLDQALERAAPAGGTPVRTLWEAIARHLQLGALPPRPTAADLYELGQAARAEAVSEWVGALKVAPLSSGRSIDRFEEAARESYGRREGTAERDAQLVMAVLAMEEAAVARFAPDAGQDHTIQLTRRGELLRRSLLLPGGVVFERFPEQVRDCLQAEGAAGAGCLRELMGAMQRLVGPRIHVAPSEGPPDLRTEGRHPPGPRPKPHRPPPIRMR